MNDLNIYIKTIQEELEAHIDAMNQENLKQAKDLILNQEQSGKRVHVTGIGKPSYVAGYIASLLSSIGTKAYFLDGTEAVHGSAGQVDVGDVVIAISNSGQTSELRYTVETLKSNGARIIAVSGNEESWLAKNSDVFLKATVSKEGDGLNKPPRASILVEMFTLQCLSILLQAERNLDSQKYVKWHPGGALGASISQDKNTV
ncbi:MULTISPECIES: SIS domain-containing protein [Terrabacteria group]|uniref:SIS domain-containing protein n=1 Tax=Bacillati TaxID=1783272 RepID=UPI00193960D4|nr:MULTISPECIES: SIS domain-containing protein [Terrabacteria group]MBW9213129.1 SIS domain-containing protein [Trueperella sp. zg.1013]QRG86953.1 SIS domain-containing protein [Bulleidia sp. zg-1006]